MMRVLHVFSALCALSVVFLIPACNKPQPTPYKGFPKEYNLAYEEIYGHCYDSIPFAIVALDLYSEGLELNKEHRIQGTGYNLYLSDIIVPDSLLEEGEYKSLPVPSDRTPITITPFTFLPGKEYEGYPHGMYLLHIEENLITQIQVLDSGSFVYHHDSLLFTLYYRNAYGSKATYNCSFTGELIPWHK
ncbi:MAG: hypothetical protein J5884_05280 [Paludibacteraceae bacterium]|nr:hypothetical protein [Paludibacteraceae bacterium]